MEEIRDKKELVKLLKEEKAEMDGENICLSMGVEHKIGKGGWKIGTEGISICLMNARNINKRSKEFLVPNSNATQRDVNRLRDEIEPLIL